jgi:hypothetical protein
MKRIIPITALALLCICAAARAQDDAAVDVSTALPQATEPVFSLDNAGLILPGLYRGGMPGGEKDYKAIADSGIHVVVSLRDLSVDRDSPEFCAKYGLVCERFPLALSVPLSDYFFDWSEFKKAYAYVLGQNKAGYDIYIHCEHGSDRTGAMSAALVIRSQACGRTFDKDALWGRISGDLAKYGFHKADYGHLYSDIKDFVYKFDDNKDWICLAP